MVAYEYMQQTCSNISIIWIHVCVHVMNVSLIFTLLSAMFLPGGGEQIKVSRFARFWLKTVGNDETSETEARNIKLTAWVMFF